VSTAKHLLHGVHGRPAQPRSVGVHRGDLSVGGDEVGQGVALALARFRGQFFKKGVLPCLDHLLKKI